MTALDRVRAFLRETDERICDERRATPHGVALLTPSLPLVWQLNALRVEGDRLHAGSHTYDLRRFKQLAPVLQTVGRLPLPVVGSAAAAAIAPVLSSSERPCRSTKREPTRPFWWPTATPTGGR